MPLPSTERLNAIGAHAMRGVIWRHRAAGARLISADAEGHLLTQDPWDVLLPAVPWLSDAVGPLPAEDPIQREQSRGALAQLIHQVEQVVRESGDPERAGDFSAAQWVADFLVTRVPVLARRPADLMHTLEGQRQVFDVVARMQSGAYG